MNKNHADMIPMTPIGMIHTPFNKPVGTPIQGSLAKNTEGIIELRPEYKKGLTSLDGFFVEKAIGAQ